MNKTFEQMRAIDVTPFVEKRGDGEFLNWAKCKQLLHENGAETVYFEPCVNENGSSLFMSDMTFTDPNGNTNRCYEVRVRITIDGLTFEAQHPVMNGCNPVKDLYMNQQRVWNAQVRAFVKGVAMRTGLGFDLWLKSNEEHSTEEDLSKHHIFSVRERLQQEYTKVLREKYLTTKEIAECCQMTEDEVKVLFTFFDQIDRFEKNLLALL